MKIPFSPFHLLNILFIFTRIQLTLDRMHPNTTIPRKEADNFLQFLYFRWSRAENMSTSQRIVWDCLSVTNFWALHYWISFSSILVLWPKTHLQLMGMQGTIISPLLSISGYNNEVPEFGEFLMNKDNR